MYKKTIPTTLLSTLLLASVLTACSSSNNSTSPSSTGSTDKQVKLTVWGMGDEAKSLPTIVQEFEKENPTIKVEVQALPWSSAHDKLLTAIASKSGPDVIQMGTSWIPEFAAAGALMDLTPYIKQYPEFNPDNFYTGSVNTTKYKNLTVGIPWYAETRVLYYRTDLLKQVGYNEAPKTWDELQDAAKKLTARGKGKYGINIDPAEGTLGFMFARQNGSKLFDDQNNPLFNQPEFVEAIDYLNSFFKDGTAPVDLGLDVIQAFKGDAIIPMFISGPWMINPIKEQAPELEGKWATAVLPTKKNNISALGGSDLSVFQFSKNQEASLKFIAFMSKPDTQTQWRKLTNSLPAVLKAWEDPALKDDANYQIISKQLKSAEPMPLITSFEQISQKYITHFEQIYRGKANVQTEMDTLNAEAKQLRVNKHTKG
ncbi:sugar ABC transporter substrate-binding protein [Paenibacillus sp. N3.4]|uniref:sugar ABC transporter substrate-binding protein n=1 Tax=Paenibacillus sp. N3.4 TaxID=2603222 RepID=UPI0011C7F8EB|nr:sugar ABC transporter substrate-binding protein [Paenibacillus sp. N3.4]TXK81012.1 sugar ABC transporter substrate-binding protein [Paenibacillus sp. N3.4]